ncbi:MAG: ABC transporter substrate-binding protein [Spirochaetota bacterium]
MRRASNRGIALFVALLFILCMAGAAFAGGGKEEKAPEKPIDMTILGIGGWVPSRLGVDMSPMFAEYAKEKYGYEVNFSFAEAPFSALFQKAAASLATKSQEYNLIISDSQWLGAFAEPGWIVNINQVIENNPELDIEWYDPVVVDTYMTYPDGSDQLWGFPEEGDVIVLYVRKDYFSDPEERQAFKQEYGFDLPQTFEDWEKVTMTQFEKMADFFTRPDEGIYGTAMQYQKEYDFMTMYLYPFMFSLGGKIWDPQDRRIYGVLNSDINAKAMEWNKRMLDYMPPGALNYGISEETDAFTQGKIVTAFQWAAVGAVMIPDKLKGKVQVVPPPAFERPDGSVRRVYSIGGQPWVINKFNDEQHMKVAIDFLKWWYLPETQLEYARRGGNPCDKDTLTSPGFEDIQPWFRAYKYMLREDRARDFWHEPKYSEMLAVQQEGWTGFASGQYEDPNHVLEWIACQQQKILYDAGRTEIAPPDECKGISLGR